MNASIALLGTGTRDELLPVELSMPTGKKVKLIRAGDSYTIAILEDGSVYSWGLNSYGQLVLGNTTNDFTPTCISALIGKKVKDIAVSYSHALALLEDGSVMSWGNNEYGQLGISNAVYQRVPTEITTLRSKIK